MNEIVGNLGEPIDYAEYQFHDEDEDGTQDDDAHMITERRGLEDGDADLEMAGPSGSGSGNCSVSADVLVIDRVELDEVRPTNFCACNTSAYYNRHGTRFDLSLSARYIARWGGCPRRTSS